MDPNSVRSALVHDEALVELAISLLGLAILGG
jgi:hypothetical protein